MDKMMITIDDIWNDRDCRGWVISAVVYSIVAIVVSIWAAIPVV